MPSIKPTLGEPKKGVRKSLSQKKKETAAKEQHRAEKALEEKTHLSQTLLDAFPCVALLLRPRTREIIASNAAAVKVGAVPGAHCFSTWGQRQDSCPWCLAPALWASGEAQHLKVEALGVFWDASWIPISDDLYMHFAFDITARKKAEAALRESEERYRLLMETLPDAVVVHSQGRIVFANPASAKLMGAASPADLLGRPVIEFVHPDYRELVLKRIRQSLSEGVLAPIMEEKFIRLDGTEIYVKVTSIPFSYAGQPAMLTIINDITERKRAEEKIQSLARFPSENPDPILRIAHDGTLLYTNQAGLNLLPEWHLHVGQAASPMLREAALQAMDRGSPQRVDFEHGQQVYSFSIAPIVGAGYANLYARNVTERRQTEEALREMNEHLEIRVQERTVKLEQANRALEAEIAERKSTEEAVKRERQRLYDVLETLPVYVVLLSADYHVPFANRFFRQRFGESEGRRCYEYLFHRDAPCEICETYTVLKTAAPHKWKWTGPDGRNYDIFDFSFTDEGGAPLILEMGIDITERNRAEAALQKAHDELGQRVAERTEELRRANEELRTDITERKRAEETLRNHEGMLQRIFDLLPVGLWFADKDGKLLRGNPAGVKIWGAEPKVDPSEYGVFKARRLPSGEEVAPDDWALAHTIRDKVTIVDELLEIDAFDGKKKTILNYTAPVLDAQGDVQGAIVVNQDITERKKSEDDLRKSESRLRSLSAEIARVEENERQRLALFLHDEIGQSLALLQMKLGSFANASKSKSDKHDIKVLRDLLETIIEQTHTLTFELSPPVLHQLGLEAAIEWAGEKISRDHGLDFTFNDDGMAKSLNPDLQAILFRCVRELMLNTVKHAKAKRLTVAIAREGEKILYTIADDGLGFDPSLHDTRTEETGFGLLSVREHLATMGGNCRIQSTPGQGTRITLTVPVGGGGRRRSETRHAE